jgi:hypothetical protein
LTDLASLVTRLQADNSQYIKALDQATQKLSKFQKDQDALLGSIADKVAAAFTIDKLVQFGSATLELEGQLQQFSQQTGVSVEQMSGLQFAAASTGVASDQLQNSFKKLNESIAEAAASSTSKAALAFNAMGVSIKNADGTTKDAGTVIDLVADKFAGYADGANKVALATDLFGKSGQTLIPLLDKGASGIEALKDQAAAAGAVIGGQTAAAAEEFNNKMLLLKTTLIDGVGAQMSARLLPVLNDLANQMLSVSQNTQTLDNAAEVLAAGLKLLVSSGTVVKSVFVELGDAVGGAAAAVGAAAHGNFAEAMAILNDQSAQAAARQKGDVESIAQTWAAGTDQVLTTIDVAAKKILEQAPPVIDLKPFLDKLQAYAVGLQEQVAKLDQGTIAATKYKLAHGELAEALTKTGAAGKAFADQALAAASSIEAAQLKKEIGDINAQLADFKGDTVTATMDKFAASTATLTQRLHDLGGAQGEAGLASVAALQTATQAEAEYQKLVKAGTDLEAVYAGKIADVQLAQTQGRISDSAAQSQLNDLQVQEIANLQGVYAAEKAISDGAGIDKLTQQTQAFSTQIVNLQKNTQTLENTIRGQLESAFADNFSDLITGAESFQKAFTNMVKSIQKDIANLVSKDLSQAIFGTGGPAGGAAGGLASLFGGGSNGFGFLANLFGGGGASAAPASIALSQNGGLGGGIGNLVGSLDGFATGGTLSRGNYGIVGENGPELAYSGSKDMHIQPGAGGKGGQSIVNNFTVQAPGGTITRQSQTQAAAEVARQVSIGARRNG